MTDRKVRSHRARLSVLFAAAAPTAVILRRGPKNHWSLTVWDLASDTFTAGQWVKGDVALCDLSPSGRRLIYRFEPRGAAHIGAPERQAVGNFTAVSKPPYFTALAVWPKVGWISGGNFISEDEIYIGGAGHAAVENVSIPASLCVRFDWPRDRAFKTSAGAPSEGAEIRSGPLWDGLAASGVKFVDWAHIHADGDMLLACDGVVYRRRDWKDLAPSEYLARATQLADFRDQQFALVPPSPDALRW